MKKLLFLFILSCTLQVKAQTNVYQPFPKDSAVWLYIITNSSTNSQNWIYTKWLGDTVINSKTYTKIYGNTGNANGQFGYNISWTYTGGIRQDIPNEKTYQINANGVESDVSVNQHLVVGDTMFFAGSLLLIRSIDSVLIGNKYHKRYNAQDSASTYFQNYIVGVGVSGTSFPQGYGELTCFTVNNIGQLSNGGTPPFCQLTSINKFQNSSYFIVYPNPSQNNFTIETNSAEKQTLQLFDVNGKQVLLQIIYGTTNIDVANLSSGVYSLNITNSQTTVTKKLVIVK